MNYLVQLSLADEVENRHTFVGSKTRHRNHSGVTVSANNETFYLVGIASEFLAEEVFETAAIQCATHTDNAVARQAERFQGEVCHGVHRVGNHDKDSIRRVGQHLISHALYDTGVYADEFFTCHTGFTWQTAGDDYHVGVCCLGVVVGNAFYHGIKAQ